MVSKKQHGMVFLFVIYGFTTQLLEGGLYGGLGGVLGALVIGYGLVELYNGRGNSSEDAPTEEQDASG